LTRISDRSRMQSGRELLIKSRKSRKASKRFTNVIKRSRSCLPNSQKSRRCSQTWPPLKTEDSDRQVSCHY
jgi:hypothetical protein